MDKKDFIDEDDIWKEMNSKYDMEEIEKKINEKIEYNKKLIFSLDIDAVKEMIKKNNNLNNTDNYITILDVISNQRFNIFEKDKNGSRVRKTIENIRVRLELER